MDKINLKGRFKLIEVMNDKENVVVDEQNKIVNTSFQVLVNCLQGTVGSKISSLALGDGGIVNSELQTPNVLDTHLYHETLRFDYSTIITESILKPFSITWRFILNEDEGNGIGAAIYNEAGLYSLDGVLFSRKTFTESVKTPEKKFIIEWKIEYSPN